MKYWVLAFLIAVSSAAWSQSAVDLVEGTEGTSDAESTIDNVDDDVAKQILDELDKVNKELEQVNVLGATESRKFATLRFLDRLNGEVKDIEITAGSSRKEQYLNIEVKSCYVPKSKENKDAVAFLVIQDERHTVPDFDGWMIASSPALSALDHARYDVWVVSCSNEGKSVGVADPASLVPVARDAGGLVEVN